MLRTLSRYQGVRKELDEIQQTLDSYTGGCTDGRTIGFIKSGSPSLTENLRDVFSRVAEYKSSLDHCFEDDVSLDRWMFVNLCDSEDCGDDDYYHRCGFVGTVYTLIHDGEKYYRSMDEKSYYSSPKAIFEKHVKVPLTKTSYTFKTEKYEVDPILQKYRTIAQYGDVEKKATLTDENIRKGHDIDLQKHTFVESRRTERDDFKYPPEQNGMISVSDSVISAVRKVFIKTTKMANVTVVPHKLNIYHEGDHFADHKDTPEPNLVATVVLLISGKSSDTILENKTPWGEGNMLIMFPDVLHRVNPVSEYRETLTFKVFSKWRPSVSADDFTGNPTHNLTEEDSRIFSKFEQFVDTGNSFAVLLQGEYTIDDITAHHAKINTSESSDQIRTFPFKGVDQKLATMMEIAKIKYGLDVFITPVILKCYSYDDCDNNRFDRDYEEVEIRPPTYNQSQTAGEIMTLSTEMMKEFEIPDELQDKFQSFPHIKHIYTLGYGDKTIGNALFERIEYNVHYGNEYRGTLTSTVYWHVVFCAVPQAK
ncbi:hypothetical protein YASMINEVIRUS_1511 [Yasminevirus sp. GU-2018]|uniref:Fe2OG dioxygenase domain-containing protein n=1 Tax=Yasminevirus sp. GU-2018 TaxID=2420051 RepID=A0A5K0UA57_9VIRU|nr:hypothetical protein YASMINEVIRUS_1511 [Yasminevirus sp. GU-2018]